MSAVEKLYLKYIDLKSDHIKLKAAAEKIKHWHCSDNGGMIVSAKSVHELWEVLKDINK